MDPYSVQLEGGEVHGFRTLADLDLAKLRDDASSRWLRPNEIHAILTNSTQFSVQPQPLEYPNNGSIVLFDRKMLRNFRKDGYNWKKKKDGKTVQEAHEKLKIGNEDKIHVYYARGEDDPNFCRRCYWLLDKKLEHIVLVHYRQTLEQDNVPQALIEYKHISDVERKLYDSSPTTPMNSISGSEQSDLSGSAVMSEEINSKEDHPINTGMSILKTRTRLHINELSQHEINSLGWADLALASEFIEVDGGLVSSDVMRYKSNCPIDDQGEAEYLESPSDQGMHSIMPIANRLKLKAMIVSKEPKIFDVNQSSPHQKIFIINGVSPEWGYSTEETKVMVIGSFLDSHKHLEGVSIYCMLGELCVSTQMVQPGVYKCTALPQIPGNVSLFLTLDGHTPISQVITYQYREVPKVLSTDGATSIDGKEMAKPKDINSLKRLAHLLFSTSGSISLLSSKLLPKATKAAKRFEEVTSPLIENDWKELLESGAKNNLPFNQACENLFKLVLKNKLQEWLMEKIAGGCRTMSLDSQGQSAIHLCTILDYTWAVRLFQLSGFSIDFRDSCGWTALHWAAYLGRVEMAAALLSAGANPSLVTHPTPENAGGLVPADLASEGGHDGLAAYLAEKGLTAHFNAMSLSGNIPSAKDSGVSKDQLNPEENFFSELLPLTEEEVCLKESLTAYRNAADAADRIQAAFRERTLKIQTAAAQQDNPELEAARIISALRIQHAFRNHNRRKLLKAAARIQSHFRTWRVRKDFLNLRRQVIRIQAVFRGLQVRKQYRKIIWVVGVLDKAVLRWRLKRKGLRGMQAESMGVLDGNLSLGDSSSPEEDFFKISRKQAEERVQRSVVRVQAMFRSHRAQQEYRKMKSAHEQAKVEFSSSDAAWFH